MVATASSRTAVINPVPDPGGQGTVAAQRFALPSRGGSPASPDEGAALIRAFVRLEQREVREAVTEFVTRLSDALAKGRK